MGKDSRDFPMNWDEFTKYLEMIRKQMPSLSRSDLEKLYEAQRILSSVPKEIFTDLPHIQERLSHVSEMVNMVTFEENLAKVFAPFRQGWLELAQKTKLFVEYSRKTVKEAGEILFSLGWWIYPEWDLPSLRNIIDMHKKGKDKEIEEAIIDYFNEEKLGEMSKNWESNPKLGSRIHILKDAIWAHKQGKYTLSVPTLLPQLEGIIAEGLGIKGKATYKQYRELLKNKIVDKREAFIFVLGNSIYKVIEEMLKIDFEWGQDANPKMGRHPVLHGFYVKYDKKANSLKLILLIDYLQKALSEHN